MKPMDWDDFRHFLEVARTGSVTAAGAALQVNHTTVSRRISALEKRLGTRLFERTSLGWQTTAAGEKILAEAESISDHVSVISRQVLAETTDLRGLVRVTTGEIAFRYLLLPILDDFIREHPEIDLELISSDRSLDLGSREADIAVRFTASPPEDSIARRIGDVATHGYGTPDLQRRYDEDRNAHDLPVLTWLGDGISRPDWIKKNVPQTRRVVRISDLSVMLEAAKRGMGIAQLPCMIADSEPGLVRVCPAKSNLNWGVWVLSHVDLRTTARVRALRDAIVEGLSKQKNLFDGQSNPARQLDTS